MPSVPCTICNGNRGTVIPSRYFEGYVRICYACKGKKEVQEEYHCKSITARGKRCKQFRIQNSLFCNNHQKINTRITEEE